MDAFLALVALYAAYDLLMGGQVGWVIGLAYAMISTVRWLFFLPNAPIAAVVVIAINILIIYGLVVHADYFRASSDRVVGTEL